MNDKDSELSIQYSNQIATQMRKGILGYFILTITRRPIYTSDIIKQLDRAGLKVVEGTIYPLLSRLQKEGLLNHEWRESTQGPPRKYYHLTDLGKAVLDRLKDEASELEQASNKLEQEEK